jgi:two-component system response regulator YesN
MKNGSTILIVEDEDMHRLILKKVLESYCYKVLDAANGAEGLEVLRTVKVDLAIVDLEMPVMDGMEFTKWVKEIHPNFPLIIVTAHASSYSPKEILDANVNALLSKPLQMDELIKLVERL